MLRLITTSIFPKLWKRSLPFFLPTAVKEGAIGHLPFSHQLHSRARPSPQRARFFSAGCPARRDATPKPEEREQIDLDGWKSVMRSQVTADEKQGDDDSEGAEGVTLGGAPGDAKEDSVLEATRELVLMWRESGKRVPANVTDEQLRELAKLTTKSSKKSYLQFLANKERIKEIEKEKKQKRRAEWESMKVGEDEEGKLQQPRNTFLRFFRNKSLDTLLSWRSAQSMIFGQPLIFDMSYEHNMKPYEIANAVAQLMEVEAWNRRAVDPFHLHFCNLQPDGAYMKELLKRYGSECFDHLLMTTTNHHHADLFPRERLVYLTADSPNILRSFDHTKVYIVGAFVDRKIQKGVSLANAKRLNLATARLPLDECLQWGSGAKNLTLDQMMRILLTIKDTGKWEDALSFVPQRKHHGLHQQQPEKCFSSKGGYRDRKSSKPTAFRMSDTNEFTGTVRALVRERNEDSIAVSRSTGSPQDNKPAVTRLRTSAKAQLAAKISGRNKNWQEQ